MHARSLLRSLCLTTIVVGATLPWGLRTPRAAHAQEEDPAAEARELVVLARGMLGRGSYDDALRKLGAARKADATNADAAFLQSLCLRDTGKLTEALGALEGLAATREETMRGELLLLTGQDAEAEAALRRALEQSAGNLRARRLLGAVLEATGRRDLAVETYLEVNSQWAKSEDEDTAEELLAVARARIGVFRLSDKYRANIDSVLSRFEEIRRQAKDERVPSPVQLEALVELGDLYLSMHQDQHALRWYKLARDANARYAPALFGLALQRAFRFDGPAARRETERALRENPAYVPALLFLAEMELGDGDYTHAREHIDAALAVNENDTDARSALAALHYVEGRQEEFDAEVQRVLGRDPGASVVYRTVAGVLEEQRRFAEALDMAQRALSVDDRDWSAMFLAGRNAMNVGQDEEAEKLLEAAEKGDLYRNIYRANFIALFRKMKRFPVRDSGDVLVKLPPREDEAYHPLLTDGIQWSLGLLEEKWGFTAEKPLFLSVFDAQADFATRTIGLPGFPALGACFGRVVTLDSPTAMPPGAFGWRATLHHELAHVITLQLSKGRVPRWLTEGISVYEERKVSPQWNREMERVLIDAIASGEVLTLADVNAAFRGSRVMFAYYQGGLMCEFIERDFGFDALREMVRLYGEELQTPAVVQRALGVEAAEFDRRFLAYAREYVAELRVLPRPSKARMSSLYRHLRKHKDDADGWFLYALGHASAGRSADALSALGKLKGVRPDDSRIPLVRALVASRQNRPDMAAKFATEAIDAGEDWFELRMLLARSAQRAREFEAAKGHLSRAIELFPVATGNGSPRVALAQLLLGEGEEALPTAMGLLRDHADVSEDDFSVRLRLASYYRGQDDEEAELATLLEIRDVVPLPNIVRNGRGEPDPRASFRREAALDLHLRIGDLLMQRKRYAEAELARRLAVGVARMNLGQGVSEPLEGAALADVLVKHAESLHLIGRPDEARRRLREALAEDPENPDAAELQDRLGPE